jgi:hypothetical protein
MSRRPLAFGVLFAAMASSACHAATAYCPASAGQDEAVSLPALKTSLKPGGQLDVLVIGSALGPGKAPPIARAKPGAEDLARAGYAEDMAQALQASLHGLQIHLTYDGRRFMSATDMLTVLSAGLAAHHYGLVIWQTGTADAVRDEPVGDFYQALSDGAVAAASAGASLVLVDPQFSHFLEANADIGPYLSSMQEIASTSGAMLFDRYAIMRAWAEAGQIDLENAPQEARATVAAHLHQCLGQELARSLLAAVATTP